MAAVEQIPMFATGFQALAAASASVLSHTEWSLTVAEADLIADARDALPLMSAEQIASCVTAGQDPLGEALTRLRSPQERRKLGAIFTPPSLVEPMVRWAAGQQPIARVVDHGCGSGRMLVAAGKSMPEARLVGIEIDPLTALVARANLSAAGMAHRAEIFVGDVRDIKLGSIEGRTAFIANPPYVRHHDLSPADKQWAAEMAAAMGVRHNGLAGSHTHFMLAVASQAFDGDVGVFVCAADWMSTKSGCVMRDLVAGPLGGISAHVVSAENAVFDEAMTTAAVVCFRVGEADAAFRIGAASNVDDLDGFDSGRSVPRSTLRTEQRWTALLSDRRGGAPSDGWVELGEIAQVSRGIITGANSRWVLPRRFGHLPARCLTPVVTGAGDLKAAPSGELRHLDALRLLATFPADLDDLDEAERKQADRFLAGLRRVGVPDSYTARQRSPWWSLNPSPPAPILVPAMTRRSPVFARNLVGAAHLNIVYGIQPREPMTDAQLDALAQALRDTASTADGRYLAGGLAKFEPSDYSRIRVPDVRLGFDSPDGQKSGVRTA